MKIEPPADDLGLQYLKATDRAKGPVAQVDHVERDARIHSSEDLRNPAQDSVAIRNKTTTAPLQPRQGERRSGKDRRQRQQPTLLDTRNPHERRTGLRRADDASSDDKPAPGGIDELA
jgi:hypothetical protein